MKIFLKFHKQLTDLKGSVILRSVIKFQVGLLCPAGDLIVSLSTHS